ncbi:50S ribosomal protein L37ae [Candidatus Micrarchaeota archaeon]|nr:50S ribosomal protein L37ae [Candidatus Micrarchaeota archaeon]
MLRSHKFGAKIRKLVVAALKAKKALYECPACGKTKVTRKSFAVWNCKSCEAQFAGGAYIFKSEAGEISSRLIGDYQKL